MLNDYSDNWYDIFLQRIQISQTESEVAFIARNLPRPRYQSIVDLCCGPGRHARLLAAIGYQVIGVESNSNALDQARALSGASVRYVAYDMRRVAELPGTYDAVINLWQSFGYFDEETNQDILRQIGQKLNPSGRLILDIYHREFFENHQGVRSFEKEGVSVTERKRMAGNRLQVTLTYDHGDKTDSFDWQLYCPDELIEWLRAVGFQCLIACSEFDETIPASPGKPRMQLVFEKEA